MKSVNSFQLAAPLYTAGSTWTMQRASLRATYKEQKLPKEELLVALEKTPDATLLELAQQFKCSAPAVYYRLKTFGITRKKNHPLCRAKWRKKTRLWGGFREAKPRSNSLYGRVRNWWIPSKKLCQIQARKASHIRDLWKKNCQNLHHFWVVSRGQRICRALCF